MIGINLTGCFPTHAEPLALPDRRWLGAAPSIVISVAAIEGLPFFAAYCAPKFGTQGIMSILAQELVPEEIRVNVIIRAYRHADDG